MVHNKTRSFCLFIYPSMFLFMHCVCIYPWVGVCAVYRDSKGWCLMPPFTLVSEKVFSTGSRWFGKQIWETDLARLTHFFLPSLCWFYKCILQLPIAFWKLNSGFIFVRKHFTNWAISPDLFFHLDYQSECTSLLHFSK